MSGYIKKTWESGETITADKLNRMEEGIVAANRVAWANIPHIGENGNWWIGENDTHVGSQGTPPNIGDNGNWWIGETDTGVNAEGVDYVLTEADKNEIAALVAIKIIDEKVIGTIDENNNILLSGNLSDGSYTLKYENEDGTYTEVGTLEVGALPEPEQPYTNLLPLSIDSAGNDFVGSHEKGGDGYDYGYRISKSTGAQSACENMYCSGFMPITSNDDTIRIKGVSAYEAQPSWNNLGFYDASKTFIYALTFLGGNPYVSEENGIYSLRPSSFTSGAVAFFRFSCGSITDETIVTVNEEIV